MKPPEAAPPYPSSAVVDAMNYFRAVIAAKETSERVLELTSDVIDVNSANYTAWLAQPRPLMRARGRVPFAAAWAELRTGWFESGTIGWSSVTRLGGTGARNWPG